YETWFSDPMTNLVKLKTFLDLAQEEDAELDSGVLGIIDKELRHDDVSFNDARQPLVRSVYSLALRAEHDLAARERLQKIANEFWNFQQLQSAFEHDFERNAGRANQLPHLEEQMLELRGALSERDQRFIA